MNRFLFLLCLFAWLPKSWAQPDTSYYAGYNYNNPKSYTIAGIEITGTNYYDKGVLQLLSGLGPGQKIKVPSDDIPKAINNLWKQKLFDVIKILVKKIDEDKIYLEIAVREKPRLSTFTIKGLRKGKAEDLRDELTLHSGQIITENMFNTTRREVKKHFTEKGFLEADARIEQSTDDPQKNTAKLRIVVDKGPK